MMFKFRNVMQNRTGSSVIRSFFLAASAVFCASAAQATNPACLFVPKLPPGIADESAARQRLSDITYRTFDKGHGAQIEHMTRDGRVFLWYPGNAVVLPRRWTLLHMPNRQCPEHPHVTICFQYGPNTFNPVTGARGAQRQCTYFTYFWRGRVEVVAGDPFGLARRKQPPFALPREALDLQTLIERAKER